ncbi:5'-nucleotidase C-terminal domain-containing protein [Flavobacterium luminosum]|uniref:5'-nucleotidase C-terminal domain-containing protein n=1 Tax=Flavobacterium luminosum TaxID=2949086 RepID=A0ABT0TN64_9FLAO|nr:5'-nucleotidase [Flavobacterium sp. HXWNR70]MCL9808529.1 5'-nucleotidase C-terminal domain-containing protein [Flavobacterium sp. HXWNR70]
MKHFGLILTLLAFSFSSVAQQDVVTVIEGKQINVNDKYTAKAEYEAFITPYKQKIDKDLNQVLAFNPETLDKTKGEFQSNVGDFLARIVLEYSNPVFNKRENKNIDICILNHGGIRAMIPQGDVSARAAFEMMPFENYAVVLELKGEQIVDFVNYFIKEKKPHPIQGLTFTITADKKAKDIKVKGEPIDLTKTYYVVTNDYLANGGDNMGFFTKSTQTYNLEYLLRNILIDYMKDVDTLKLVNEVKVTQEK